MLTFREYNKMYPNGKDSRSINERTNKSRTNTIIRKGEFIDFLQSVEHPMVWIKDDGDWYRFKFVDEIEMNGNNSTN